MKLQILSGALGLVLLLGLVPLQPAEAKVFLIDDFSNDPFPDIAASIDDGRCDLTTSGAGSSVAGVDKVVMDSPTRLAVLGDWRICELLIDIGAANSAAMRVVANTEDAIPFNMFNHEAGPGVFTMTELTYNGTDGNPSMGGGIGGPDAIPFNIDLTNSDDVRIMYSVADFDVDVIVRLTDSDGDWAEQTSTLAGGTVAVTSILFDNETFVLAPSASSGVLQLNDIEEISFFFDTTVALTDYVIEKLDITMEMVGGEMFPVDTTALLLAGAELNAIWILPAIAAIGIGAFIVTRKRN